MIAKNNTLSAILLTIMMLSITSSKSQAQFRDHRLPKYDKKLQKAIEGLTKDFNGNLGLYVYHLKKNSFAEINTDTLFPTASVVKVPILVGLFNEIEAEKLSFHQELIYRDSIKYGGSGLMQFFEDSTKTELSILASLMIAYSDNTTSLWCQSLAGGGEKINEVLANYGFEKTRVNSRTRGREKDREIFGWGQTTPREMAQLLIKIRRGEIINEAASNSMYRLLTNVYYNEYALSQLPPYVQAASKQGMVNDSRSELVMVNAPKGDYVFYIATKNNKDQRWTQDNEAWQLTRKIAALLWNYYEPKSKWKASGIFN